MLAPPNDICTHYICLYFPKIPMLPKDIRYIWYFSIGANLYCMVVFASDFTRGRGSVWTLTHPVID